MARFPKTKREATPEEFKALAHPLRLRILRLCLDDALTNKQIADRLGQNPATVLHHVRTLARTGFLEAEAPRTGNRGALERPYRATGKSWQLSLERQAPSRRLAANLAVVDALREELAEAGQEGIVLSSRLGLQLGDDAAHDLRQRLEAIIDEFADRTPDLDGTRYGIYVALHRRA
jgi:predicted ArsR family transcriptional regulator